MTKRLAHSIAGTLVLMTMALISQKVFADTLKWRMATHTVRFDSIPTGSVPGKALGVGMAKGVAFFEDGAAAAVIFSWAFDRVDSNGPARGFGHFSFEDGSTFGMTTQLTTTKKTDGGVQLRGPFAFVSGTGRFKGIKGKGSMTGKSLSAELAATAYVVEAQATFSLP